jgi:hypothetical protein
MKLEVPTVGWSQFALDRHKPGTGHTYTTLSNEDVVKLVRGHWELRRPGQGEVFNTRKIVVPVPAESFRCTTVKIRDGMTLAAEVTRRQPHEDPFVQVVCPLNAEPEPVNFASVVLYHKDTLEENNGKRTTDCEWEIVCLLASPVEKEPMDYLTMARNMLGRPGGSKSTYTAEEFAASIYHWSQRVKTR